MVYRSAEQREQESSELSEEEAAMASNGYRLLDGWRRVPGTADDGTLSGDDLQDWWDSVSAECSDSGHLRVAKDRLGHVCIAAPVDPDGLWIHRSVAGLLEEPEMDEARSGFTLALFNSRGVHSFTAGEQELELAEKYEEKAGAMEAESFFRLAEELRQLADGYRREAQRAAERDLFDD